MGSVFKFKEFEVNQEGCAMKINTDGVLLGAMVEAQEPIRILDVGSGTGVIALMLAQRFPDAMVDAVDIDETAYQRTEENFKTSRFAERMYARLGDFETMSEQEVYDLIVSNPPFYINALHNPNGRKRLARHTDLDFFKRLLTFSSRRLSSRGTLQLVLPVDLSDELLRYTDENGLILIKEVGIRSFAHTEPIRKIMILGKENLCQQERVDFVIYEEKGVYSKAYQGFLKPFFLGF
ncbi:tRNA1(Val) (adenine(37)-N6)-methyltransferase [Sphingobacterium tabacisoli]|uniref:tRNA1(Val) (adenine(37)-N6)-methyltransferase n=1 Tax=Sphingobacterium tabacisoli TaxID=2044855 RepID=A0ABW5KWK7_9SPHI|nr:methyltransferase [Sphingobacterium tabacisoli]